jgi:magnesium chelatase subunit D
MVHSSAGETRDRWMAYLDSLLPPATPIRKIPLHTADARLLGGLDLAATLRGGHPVADAGILTGADGGVVVLAMAERVSAAAAARIAAVLDTRHVALEREGFAMRAPARVGVVAFDEATQDDDAPALVLADRMAFPLDLSGIRAQDTHACWHIAGDIAAARSQLHDVRVDDAIIEALCATALALGVASPRISVLAVRVAKASAALDRRNTVSQDDAALAARLVMSPRATTLPTLQPGDANALPENDDAEPESQQAMPEPPASAGQETTNAGAAENAPAGVSRPSGRAPDASEADAPLADTVLAAARAAIPQGLLARLRAGDGAAGRERASGRVGALQRSSVRGRPVGAHRGDLRRGARLNVIETLRAAAPWQTLRRREASETSATATRLHVKADDFRVTRFRQRRETTTIFAVDASGSAALHRLAEAKGAVELLLADCYVRRDRVAVIAFRGRTADVLLPPTRSLVRAKRGLAGLAGGGGTPLAAAIDTVTALVASVRRRGGTPSIVLLTDGRANVSRDGTPGRAAAAADAVDASRRLRLTGADTLLIDTSQRGDASAQALAAAMHARYLALPCADAASLSRAAKDAAAACANAPLGQ